MKEIYRSERSEAMADIYKDVMYDYCAILIISILIITTILRRMVKGKVNRSFMEVLVVAWLAVKPIVLDDLPRASLLIGHDQAKPFCV